jgi:CubicO group peptidase (beta-lactamase class C family)
MNNWHLSIIFILLLFQSCSPQLHPGAQEQVTSGIYLSTEAMQPINPVSAGWDPEFLANVLDYARENASSGILILYRGNIITEEYWGQRGEKSFYEGFKNATDDGRPMEDIASMQKSIISLLIGIACDKEMIYKHSPVNNYIDKGWSLATSDIENSITIAHLLSMTSGLGNNLEMKYHPGEAWQYNTAAYNILMKVLTQTTGKSLQEISDEWLFQPLDITDSYWTKRSDSLGRFPNRLIATHRDLARIAQLIINRGTWENRLVYHDSECIASSFIPSQEINKQYGHLFWLNTQNERNPFAPADLIEMVGAKERFVTILPLQNIVVVRMGEEPKEGFYLKFWSLLQKAVPAHLQYSTGEKQK